MTILTANVLFSHVVDIHLPNPSEHSFKEEYEREQSREASERVLEDPSSSNDDRIKALSELVESGHWG